MTNRHLRRHHLVASEVLDLLAHLVDYLRFVSLIDAVFLQKNFREAFQCEVGLVLVPEEDLSESFAFNLEIDLDRHQTSKLIFRLVIQRVVFQSIVGALQQVEL